MRRPYIFILLPALLYLLPGEARAASILHRPPPFAVENLDLRIEAGFSPGNSFSHARLYYKQTGNSFFYSVLMRGNDRRFYAVIPGSHITTRGITYYIEVTRRNGQKSITPDRQGRQLNVQSGRSVISVNIQSPLDNEQLPGGRPLTFRATAAGLNHIAGGAVLRVYYDRLDITSACNIRRGSISFTLARQPGTGRHTFLVTVHDTRGQMIQKALRSFTITAPLDPAERAAIDRDRLENNDPAALQEPDARKPWQISGSITANASAGRVDQDGGGTNPVQNPDGSYAVAATVQGKRNISEDLVEEFSLGPFSYTSALSSPGTRSASYSFSYGYGPWQTTVGTTSAELTSLAGGGAGFFGATAAHNTYTTHEESGHNLTVFAGQTAIPLEQNEDEQQLGRYGQAAGGTDWRQVIIAGWLESRLSVVTVHDQPASITRAGLIPQTGGQVAGFELSLHLPFELLNRISPGAAVSQTSVISPYIDEFGRPKEQHDKTADWARSLDTAGRLPLLQDYTVNYIETGPEYLTVLGSSTPNSRTVTTRISQALFSTRVSLGEGLELFRDNLDESSPTTTSSTGVSADLGLNLSWLPDLSFNNSFTEQRISGLPAERSRQFNNAFSAAATTSTRLWSNELGPALNYSRNDVIDKNDRRKIDDTLNQTAGLSTSIKPPGGRFDFALGLTVQQDTNLTKEKSNPGFGENVTVTVYYLKGKLSHPTVLSHNRTFEERKPLNDTYTVNSSLNWVYTEQRTLGISAGITRFIDHGRAANSYTNYNAGLSYNEAF